MARDEATQREEPSSEGGSTGKKNKRPGGSKGKVADREKRGRGPSPLRSAENPEGTGVLEPGRAGILAALEIGLADALPGVEMLDREVVFDGEGQADLLGVDPKGRLVIVLLAGEDADRAVLDALDALAYARRQTRLLARHLGSRRVNPARPPRLVVIDPSNDVRLGERLVALEESSVEVLGVRTLRSAAGERSYLVPHPDSEQGRLEARGVDATAGVEAFLRGLPAALTEVGRLLVRRMTNLDADLRAEAERDCLLWRWNETRLAEVELCGDALIASIDPHVQKTPIREPADLEVVLEQALERLVEAFDDAGEEPRGDWGTAAQVQRVPLGEAEGPILTQEEIQAFHG